MRKHPQQTDVLPRDRAEPGRAVGLILAVAASIGFWVATALIVVQLLG